MMAIPSMTIYLAPAFVAETPIERSSILSLGARQGWEMPSPATARQRDNRNAFDGLSQGGVNSIMHAVQSELGDAQLLTLTGRLDGDSAPELEQQCERLITPETRMLIINV